MGPGSISLRYVVFAALLLYAHTADFVATSFFANGHDSNHPVLRIEHKCVTRSAGIPDNHTAPPVIVPPVAILATTLPSPLEPVISHQAVAGSVDRQSAAPGLDTVFLRC